MGTQHPDPVRFEIKSAFIKSVTVITGSGSINCYWMQVHLEAQGAFMITRATIAVGAAFLFALTVGILTANLAESGNDRASTPTIPTLALQY